jgi:hypothetical protein
MNAPQMQIKYTVVDGQAVTVTAWTGDAQIGTPDFELDGMLLVADRPNETSGSVRFADGAAIRGKKLRIRTSVRIYNPDRPKTSVWYEAIGGAGKLSTHNAATSPDAKTVYYKDLIEFI